MSTAENKDIELGPTAQYVKVPQTLGNSIVTNPTFEYFDKIEKVHGYLSKQFPTTANPAPLGLCAFALTTFVLSMMNAGGLRCKCLLSKVLLFLILSSH